MYTLLTVFNLNHRSKTIVMVKCKHDNKNINTLLTWGSKCPTKLLAQESELTNISASSWQTSQNKATYHAYNVTQGSRLVWPCTILEKLYGSSVTSELMHFYWIYDGLYLINSFSDICFFSVQLFNALLW